MDYIIPIIVFQIIIMGYAYSQNYNMFREQQNYRSDVIKLLILYIISAIICFCYAPKIEKMNDGTWHGQINKFQKKCFYDCKGDFCKNLTKGRGDTYFTNTPIAEQLHIKECLVSFWSLTHILLYTLIGFLFPGLFFETLLIGIGFEIYEHFAMNCADPLDIVFNTSGFLLGAFIARYVKY